MKKTLAFVLAITLCILCFTSCKVSYVKNEWFSDTILEKCLVSELPTLPEGKSFVNCDDSDVYVSLSNAQFDEYVSVVYLYLKERNFKYLGTRGDVKTTLSGAFTTYFYAEASYLSQFYVNGTYKFVYSDGSTDENGSVVFSILTLNFKGKSTLTFDGDEFTYNTVISLRHGSEAEFSGFYALPREGDHQHIYGEWEYDESFHWCNWDCTWDMCDIDTTAEHFDNDGDGACDACEYYIGKPHKYHDYYLDVNEESHKKIFTCDCKTGDFEPHFNNDGDEFCDECGWNMVGHEHTIEKTYDEFGHGWYYTCGCDTPPNMAQHYDGDDNGKCDDCEYVTRTTGLVYEKMGRDSYTVVGFLGDEDGIVEIPDTYNGLPVISISGNAFYGQEAIVEVIIGDNVQAIEGNAFMNCYNLKKVTLGDNLEVIDQQVFMRCAIKEIVIPASVRFIGNGAFRYCENLKSIILESPDGWCTSDDLYNRPFPVEDMSNPVTVTEYFTEAYVRVSWIKE